MTSPPDSTLPIPAVGVVVWRGGEVLLVRRRKPPRRGQWSLPGGRQEPGETIREAAAREVREETGLTIRVGRLLDVIDSISRNVAGGIEFHYTLVDYDADWVAGEAAAADDVTDVTWAHPDDLTQFDLWDETVRVIRLSRARRGG